MSKGEFNTVPLVIIKRRSEGYYVDDGLPTLDEGAESEEELKEVE